MQPRFCHCGHKILVNYRYLPSRQQWTTVFLETASRDAGPLLLCPHCGSPLDINKLS